MRRQHKWSLTFQQFHSHLWRAHCHLVLKMLLFLFLKNIEGHQSIYVISDVEVPWIIFELNSDKLTTYQSITQGLNLMHL